MRTFISSLLIIITSTYTLNAQHTVSVKKGQMTYTLQGDTTTHKFKATIAKYEDRIEDAAKHLVKAIENNEYTEKNIHYGYYDAACYFAQTNNSKEAVTYLLKSIENGWDDLGHVEHDKDLAGITKSDAWKAKITPQLNKYYKNNNRELAKIFGEDQKARLSGQLTKETAIQDSIRRNIVMRMLKNNELKSGHDYYRAGFIMHHGTTVKDYQKAQELLTIALKKESMHFRTPWLFAASKDRLLLKQGKPQWYGTQNLTVVNGKMALDPKTIDTTAVSSEKRKTLNAPSIEKLRTYLKNFKTN